MITPPPRFHAVVLWSKLRVLTLCPHGKEEMACLQPILDAACNTLEELYLTNLVWTWDGSRPLCLAGLANLRDLTCLRVFALYSVIECNTQESPVVRDINCILSTIPTSNQVTSLSFSFSIRGKYSFGEYLKEDRVGICDEVVSISGGKHLNLDFKLSVESLLPTPGEDKLYECIMETTASLSEYPNICTHFCCPARSET